MSPLHQLAFAVVLAVATPPLVAISQESATVQGAWTLNRDLTPPPPKRDDDVRRPEGRPPGGGGGGGFPGGGVPPGGGVGDGGKAGSRQGPSDLQIDGMPEGRGGRGDQRSSAPPTRIYDAGKQAPWK